MLKCNSLSNMKVCHKVAYLLVILMVAACSTTQSRYVPLVIDQSPKAEDHPILIFHESVPERPFERITRIDVHLEKTHFISSDL